MKISRNDKGSMITLATVLLLFLIVLGLGFIAFLMFMGGQSETKNATDAGTLNVGKKALDDVTVNLGPQANQQIYRDVATDDPHAPNGLGGNQINLRRINRVWAKALLIQANAEDARIKGSAGSGSANATQAYNGAKTISDQLSTRLNNETNLHGFFNDYASKNSVRMLGKSAQIKVKSGANWQTSAMDRGAESNIYIPDNSAPNRGFPPHLNLNNSNFTQSTRSNIPANASNYSFLKGYNSIRIGNKSFWFVPFLYDAKPHLVSRRYFEQMQPASNPIAWTNPVPNAFSTEGIAGQTGSVNETARSWVLTNPRQTFKLAIPHSFLDIQLDQMKSKWYFYPVGFPIKTQERNYNYIPTSQSSISFPGGVGCTSVSSGSTMIGTEVAFRSLDHIIFGGPSGNTSELESYMVNRMNEMVTEVGESKSASDLHRCLRDASTTAVLAASQGETHFYMFSPNGKDVVVRPKALAIAQAPWLATKINKNPDGSERKLINNAKSVMLPLPSPFCTVVPLPLFVMVTNLKWGTHHKDVWWTPGTGYNGNVGKVRVFRSTKVNSLGVCVFP